MKYFKQMIEVVKKQGVRYVDSEKSKPLGQNTLEEHFWKQVERCEVFVFTPKHDEPRWLPETAEAHKSHTATINADGSTTCEQCNTLIYPEIDAPFPVFSYEILGGKITVARPGETPANTLCVMVWEIEPKKYCYYALMEIVHENSAPTIMVINTNTFGLLTQNIFKRLERERDGVEKVREKIKIGTGQGKRFHTVRRIIHVCPKSEVREYEALGRTIDFSHRFSVRGHWRSIGTDKLGKDREGTYCITNWTWVMDHTKGPKDKPTVHKVRMVDDKS